MGEEDHLSANWTGTLWHGMLLWHQGYYCGSDITMAGILQVQLVIFQILFRKQDRHTVTWRIILWNKLSIDLQLLLGILQACN